MTHQLTLELSEMPQPDPSPPKRTPARPATPRLTETPAEQALRFRREAAEIRAELRAANTPQSVVAAQAWRGSTIAGKRHQTVTVQPERSERQL